MIIDHRSSANCMIENETREDARQLLIAFHHVIAIPLTPNLNTAAGEYRFSIGFFSFFFLESAFVTCNMYVSTKTRAGDCATRLV